MKKLLIPCLLVLALALAAGGCAVKPQKSDGRIGIPECMPSAGGGSTE